MPLRLADLGDRPVRFSSLGFDDRWLASDGFDLAEALLDSRFLALGINLVPIFSALRAALSAPARLLANSREPV
jgi:hypothetical protein